MVFYHSYGKQKMWVGLLTNTRPERHRLGTNRWRETSACHKPMPPSKGRDGSLPRSHSLPSLLRECLRQKLPCSFSCPSLLSCSFLNCCLLATATSCPDVQYQNSTKTNYWLVIKWIFNPTACISLNLPNIIILKILKMILGWRSKSGPRKKGKNPLKQKFRKKKGWNTEKLLKADVIFPNIGHWNLQMN